LNSVNGLKMTEQLLKVMNVKDGLQQAAMRTAIRNNRRLTIMELSNEFQISFGSVQTILMLDLGMIRVATEFVPKQIATDLLEYSECDGTFLKSIISGDDTCVYCYDLETKIQSSQWKTDGSSEPKEARQVRSQVKVVLTVFSIVYHRYAPKEQILTKEYYIDVLRRLRDAAQSGR